jgi:hypothetical protein
MRSQSTCETQKKACNSAPARGNQSSDLRLSFTEVEDKLEELNDSLRRLGIELDALSKVKLAEFEESWRKAQRSLAEQISRFKLDDLDAARIVDTAKVRARLAKMEASDLREEILDGLDQIMKRTEGLLEKTAVETGGFLKKLSNSCARLRQRIVN